MIGSNTAVANPPELAYYGPSSMQIGAIGRYLDTFAHDPQCASQDIPRVLMTFLLAMRVSHSASSHDNESHALGIERNTYI